MEAELAVLPELDLGGDDADVQVDLHAPARVGVRQRAVGTECPLEPGPEIAGLALPLEPLAVAQPIFEIDPINFFCIDPDDEMWFRGNDRLHEKLNALGVSHTADLTTQAGGHSWTYFNHMAETTLSFLVAGLERESRRLL